MEVTCLERKKRYKGQITSKGAIHFFNRYLAKASNLLDLGAGDGALLGAIKSSYSNINVVGIDINPNSEYVIKGDITKMPFENDQFDCITCMDVIEHLPDNMLNAAITEMHRVLKVGGYALITTLLEEDLTGRVCECPYCGHIFHRIGHIQSFSEKELKEKFASAGFNMKHKKITHFGLYSYYPIIANIAGWLTPRLNMPHEIKTFLKKDIIVVLEK